MRSSEAISRRPDYADAHYMLGTILKQQGAAAEALAEFREAVKYRPESAEAHLSLGQMLRQAGEADAAAAEMREAERLNRKKADEQASTFAVGVGLQKLKTGDLAGAVAKLREAVRLAPDNAQAHYQLALALQQTGARTEARTHFAEAQRLAPYLRPPADTKDKQ